MYVCAILFVFLNYNKIFINFPYYFLCGFIFIRKIIVIPERNWQCNSRAHGSHLLIGVSVEKSPFLSIFIEAITQLKAPQRLHPDDNRMNFFENSMTINIRFRNLQTGGYVGKRNLRKYVDEKR